MGKYKILLLLTIIALFNACKKVEVVPRHTLDLEVISKNRGSVVATNNEDGSSLDLSLIREGTTVKLSATTPHAGYVFSHWVGVDDTTGSVATVTMNEDRTVKAYFKSTSTNPVAAYGSLSVVNGKLVDQLGVKVQLKGMSLFWSQWMSQYWNMNVVNWLATNWESSVIRASMGVEASGGYISNPSTELSRVETVVDAAIARGMYVIIDWHSHSAQNYKSQAITFFQYMATKYGHQPNVIYEIYNEPVGVPWSTIKPYLQEVIDSIRVIDPDNLIIAGTPNYSQDIEVASTGPLTGTNIMYTLHFYASETGHNGLKTKLEEAQDLGVPIFVTEWGVSEANGSGNFDQTNTRDWLDLMDEYDISWCNWSIADKVETSAALQPGAASSGGWSDNNLTPSGIYVRDEIQAYGGYNTPR